MNPLHNSGIIADLLQLTDKPNGPHSVQTQLVTVKGSRSVSSILRTAITIHLRQIGDDSDDEDSNIQPSIKQEAIDFASIKLPSTLKSKQVTLSTKSEPRSANSSSTDTTSIIIQESDKLNHDTTSGSTTQEDTPPPSYLSAENSSTSHFLHPSTFCNSTNHEPELLRGS